MFSVADFFSIMNYIDGTTVSSLDVNTQVLAKSEQGITTQLFENTIDQLVYSTDDYRRLRSFLINWYASHRTMVSTQKQVSDIFSMPEAQLDELFKSFGYNFSTKSLSFLTKANFFLDLVNLYKIKGTPESIIDILGYYGLTDIDLAEYWLELDSSNKLVFRSERYLPPGVIDVPFANIAFSDITQLDPHWLLTETNIRNLLATNVIGLPSKSPYFSIRPRYNLSNLNVIMSILSRHIQDQYVTYSSGGTLTPDIKLSELNFNVSLLELYLSIVYLFDEYYNRIDGSTDPLFTCYDGTSVLDTDIILSQYENLTHRLYVTDPTKNDSRSLRDLRISQYNDLFTRSQSVNFFTSLTRTTLATLLQTINSNLYLSVRSYLLSGHGLTLLALLLQDLNDWMKLNISADFNIATTILGIESLTELNKVINFFKPYHARLISLEAAYIVNNPVADSLVMEDEIIDNPGEIVIDFDVADSTACVFCSDSTCGLIDSRETYDCGSYFDIGASIDDDNIQMYIEQNIEDYMNFHDATSSNAYEQILINDTTSSYCTKTLTVVLAGGWADFDSHGIFDAQHGNDVVEIYIQDDCVVMYAWATTSSLNTARQLLGGSGDVLDALSFGGGVTTKSAVTEIWNGAAWATTSALNVARYGISGVGTTSNSLSFGGNTGAYVSTSESWNGSSWATTSTLNQARANHASCGDYGDALCFGGYTGSVINTTEKYTTIPINVWTYTSSLNQAREGLGSCGTTAAALCFGGGTTAKVATTEIWNASTWATTTILNVARSYLAGSGTAIAAISYGGATTAAVGTTELWNGLSWSTTNALGVARDELAGCGITSATFTCGGESGGVYTVYSSIWNGSGWASAPSMNTPRSRLAACGTTSDALSIGGATGGNSSKVEIWNGAAWATTTSLINSTSSLAGCGTTLSAMCFGGNTGAYTGKTEIWNGAIWATTYAMNLPRRFLAGCGIANSAISMGGNIGASVVNTVEKMIPSTVSAWSTTSNLNQTSYNLAGCGTVLSALSFAGDTGGLSSVNEKWNGSTWTTTTSLNEARYGLAACGTTIDALSFGGYSSTESSTTEIWNGAAWATTSALNVARKYLAGCGDITDALSFGGNTGVIPYSTTEKWGLI